LGPLSAMRFPTKNPRQLTVGASNLTTDQAGGGGGTGLAANAGAAIKLTAKATPQATNVRRMLILQKISVDFHRPGASKPERRNLIAIKG
jgi:hypothetical protein